MGATPQTDVIALVGRGGLGHERHASGYISLAEQPILIFQRRTMILNHLNTLKGALQRVYACAATHNATVAVHETYRQRTVWQGNVEVFVLEGCPNKKFCYAWLDRAQPSQFFSVLENNYIRSAEMAVKSVVFFDLQPQEL